MGLGARPSSELAMAVAADLEAGKEAAAQLAAPRSAVVEFH